MSKNNTGGVERPPERKTTMQLLTKAIEKKLTDRNAELAQRNRADYHEFFDEDEVIVKYWNPFGIGTWYIMSGEKQPDGDWILFGLCELQYREWGDVSLNELQAVRVFGELKLERDRHFDGTFADLKKIVNDRRY